MRCSAEDFVRIWQTAVSIDDVVLRLKREGDGPNRRSVMSRASRLRGKGVDLKRMPSEGVLDIESLAALARELATGNREDADTVADRVLP